MRLKLMAATFGFFLVAGTAYAGPVPGGPGNDTDSDGVEAAFDNCLNVANSTQTDTDHDGCGDACSNDIACDVNGNTTVDNTDFNTLRMNFLSAVPTGTGGDCADPLNGTVDNADFNRLRMTFLNSRPSGAGPSGIVTAQCDTTLCQCTPAP